MSKVTWIDDAPVLGLGAVVAPPGSWFDSGCGAGPRARWLPDGSIEIEGEGVPVKALPKDVAQWSAQIAKAAAKHGVPPQLVAGIMATESGGQQRVHSWCCYGLMGLLPKTASEQAGRTVSPTELVEGPALNIDLGTKLLETLWKKYGGNVVKIAASYNAGGPYCSPAKGCSTVNRWGLRADCVNGKAVDYSGRVIGFSNAAVKAGVGSGTGAVSSAKDSTSLWQVLGAAVVVLPVGAIVLGLWKPAALAGVLRANPERGPLLTRERAVYGRPQLSGNWVIKEATAKRVVIYSPGSGEFGAKFAGKKYTFTWDGTGYKRQGQYLYEASGTSRSNPVDESLIKRAANILQYASPREAVEILVDEGEGVEDARLAVRAGALLLRDREEGVK